MTQDEQIADLRQQLDESEAQSRGACELVDQQSTAIEALRKALAVTHKWCPWCQGTGNMPTYENHKFAGHAPCKWEGCAEARQVLAATESEEG